MVQHVVNTSDISSASRRVKDKQCAALWSWIHGILGSIILVITVFNHYGLISSCVTEKLTHTPALSPSRVCINEMVCVTATTMVGEEKPSNRDAFLQALL